MTRTPGIANGASDSTVRNQTVEGNHLVFWHTGGQHSQLCGLQRETNFLKLSSSYVSYSCIKACYFAQSNVAISRSPQIHLADMRLRARQTICLRHCNCMPAIHSCKQWNYFTWQHCIWILDKHKMSKTEDAS